MKIHVINKCFTVTDQNTEIILDCKIITNLIIKSDEIIKTLTRLNIDPETLTFQVKATAYLKSGDTFNEEVGQRIAESKAMVKVFYKLAIMNMELRDIVDKELFLSVDKYLWALVSEKKHFTKLANDPSTSS